MSGVRPVAIALHGNFDRAEWSCDAWTEIVASDPMVLIGFSLGAIIAARFGVEHPEKFPRLFLVEGSHG